MDHPNRYLPYPFYTKYLKDCGIYFFKTTLKYSNPIKLIFIVLFPYGIIYNNASCYLLNVKTWIHG